MKPFLFLFAFLLLAPQAAGAAERTLKQKQAAAAAVLGQSGSRRSFPQALAVLHAAPRFTVMGVPGAGGYAVIANDDAFPAVLGYSRSPFSDALPDGLGWWMGAMDEALGRHRSSQPGMAEISSQKGLPASVPALLESSWGQHSPFNQHCPPTASGELPPCGCVATAFAQVMRHYRWPERGTGAHSYAWTRDDGQTQTLYADFGATAYAWDRMLDAYDSYDAAAADAVATLIGHLGVAVHMQYGPQESGAHIYDAALALHRYFDYHGDMQVRYRYRSVTAEWLSLVMAELSAGRPVVYAGATPRGSNHAFVIDGYDAARGLVHVNWGWNGQNDGMFNIDLLDAYGTGDGYSQSQHMVIGICRPDAELGYPAHLYGSGELFVSGGLSGSYFGQGIYSGTCRTLQGRLAVLLEYPGGAKEELAASATDALDYNGYLRAETYVAHDVDTLPDGTYRVYAAFYDTERNTWIPLDYEEGQLREVRFVKKGGEIAKEELTTAVRAVTAEPATEAVSVYDAGGRLVLRSSADRFRVSDIPGRGLFIVAQGRSVRKVAR